MKFKLNFLTAPKTSSTNSKKRKKSFLFVVVAGPLFVLALSYLVYIPQQEAMVDTKLKVGDIAREDIIINKDITIEDKESTEQKIKTAVENIVPIYEYNTESQSRCHDLIKEWFYLIRQSRKDYIKDSKGLGDIKNSIEKKFGLEIPEPRLSYILKSNIFAKIDLNGLLTFVKSMNEKKIVTSKIGLRKSKEGTIKVQAKEERTILKVEEIYDLKDVEIALINFIKKLPLSTNDREIISSILMEFIDVNSSYSLNLTKEEELKIAAQVNPVLIKLKSGKVILRKGDEVKPEHLKIIKLIAAAEKKQSRLLSSFYLILAVMAFFAIFARKFFEIWKSSSVNREKLLIVNAATLLLSAVIYRISLFLFPLVLKNISFEISYSIESIFYAVPFAFGSLIISFLFTLNSAVLFSFINSVVGGIICNWDFRIVLYILLGNLAVSYGIEYYHRLKRSPIIKASIFWLLPVNILTILLFNLTSDNINLKFILFNISIGIFSALIAPILANFIIPLWEVIFKLITELKLIELTNLNLPIFREMLEKAPGTYHHSQMVASLSEAAAVDLSISPLRLTAMSLYHDIGKIDNPHLFTENHSIYQNPHSNLSARESAKNIIAHIADGLERAKKLKLPHIIRASILQHHGTKLVHFFYEKAREMSSVDTDEFDDTAFRYQGEKPKNIDNAIIMLADQVEAASKSMSLPTDEELKNVIQGVITANIEENQFDECEGLTFKALNIIASSFHQKLSSIYHMRIAYPGFDFKDKKEKKES